MKCHLIRKVHWSLKNRTLHVIQLKNLCEFSLLHFYGCINLSHAKCAATALGFWINIIHYFKKRSLKRSMFICIPALSVEGRHMMIMSNLETLVRLSRYLTDIAGSSLPQKMESNMIVSNNNKLNMKEEICKMSLVEVCLLKYCGNAPDYVNQYWS